MILAEPKEMPGGIAPRDTVLVYRDRIVPKSEAHFLRRQYVGFDRLSPVWIGCRTDDGLGDLGVEPLIIGAGNLFGSLTRQLFKQFGRVPALASLKALRARVLHAHFGRGGTLALPIARALGIPLVVTYHGGDASKDKHYDRRALPTIYQRRLGTLQHEAAAIICVSDYVREVLLRRGFPAAKLHVLRYGVEIDAAAPVREPDAEGEILFAGRFVEKKGIRYLIEAARLWRARGIDRPLALIGSGPLEDELKAQAAGLDQVRFLGWQSNEAVRQRMSRAFAVCVPSVVAAAGDAEGLPNVVLEALAAGVPVIGTDEGGIIEAVEHGKTGLLVPPADAGAIADAVASLHADPAARRRISLAARQHALDRFSARAQSHLLEDLLLSVVPRS
ncbi:MAG TPA: glycosyltransferase [Aliidongia sp.]|nr:glycosyltransferase [Aliidongia sp.]